MNASALYVAISIGVLGIIAILSRLSGKNMRPEKLTPLAGLAFGLMLLGFFVAESRWIGYGAFGLAVILSVVDALLKSRQNSHITRGQDRK